MRAGRRQQIIDRATAKGTALPVTAVISASAILGSVRADDRRHVSVLRQASDVLDVLREAGCVGEAYVMETHRRRALENAHIAVVVTSPSRRRWRVQVEVSRRGRIYGGVDGPTAAVSLVSADTNFPTEPVLLAGPGQAVHRRLQQALVCLRAPQVWSSVCARDDVRLVWLTDDPHDDLGGLVARVVGPFGDVAIDLNPDGSVYTFRRRDHEGQWTRWDGAAGRSLLHELRRELGEDPDEVFFQLLTQARSDVEELLPSPVGVTEPESLDINV